MNIDLARRKAVMSRSIKLGHCVCNPKKPCPCDTFKEHDVCQCAGEKLPVRIAKIALTRHVRKAGCASKIGQTDLLRILGNLPPIDNPNVLLGIAAGDDAGVYRISETQALVQTVDVFTPCVDDPYLFGQIAAANSVSDVYAMGGKPVTALSIIGFPIDELDGDIMETMLRGAIEKLQEADCPVIGGHSINDEEIKLGFAVTGLINPKLIVQRNGAQPGDALILTKPLGTGMISFAAQIGRVSRKCLDEVASHMATLNKDAADLMVKYDAHACTDVTGYGLAGHLVEMIRGSGISAEVDFSKLPVFAAVASCLENDILPGAIERNQEYAMAWVHVVSGTESNLPVLYDPQTSGGLLISLPEENARALIDEIHERGHHAASIIGRIVEKSGDNDREGKITIINNELRKFVGMKGGIIMSRDRQARSHAERSETIEAEAACCEETASPSCCESTRTSDAGDSAAAIALFRNFMKEGNKPGLIDPRAKKLMAIALSISRGCKPCLTIHIKGALSMGISKAEIDETAGLAVAFGGCTAMMFYEQICQDLKIQPWTQCL